MTDLPVPERRRSFTAKQRNMIANRQEWRCNVCKCDLWKIAYEIDHIQRLDALGKHEPSNWQALCVPCHAIKTKVDNREAKKGRRIRGDNKPRVKKAIPSRGFNKTLRRRMDGTTERK
jgi:5-methylcytosine-specific restriction endonuclease McrA